MKYKNPIIPGMYPDPSVCCVDGVYYLVNSTFEYFPGVPIFKSEDLINWMQIGNCLTRETQLILGDSSCSEGIFAPVIRWHEGKFYMITTCFMKGKMNNFYVTTENPAGEWSDPVYIEIDGIDPSFYWEENRTYIQYAGRGAIYQVEIEEDSGKIIQGPQILTKGCGGRDTEGPHMWKRNGYYYLLLAEGGTREGHMVTMMRGKELWGPFEPSLYNPVISNKDWAKEQIQCVGHADWVIGPDGKDYLVTLGVRHLRHKSILGRETMLTPAYWTEDGWLRSQYGYMPTEWEGNLGAEQKPLPEFVLDMKEEFMPSCVISPRTDNKVNYQFKNKKLYISGNGHSLSEGIASFWGVRQTEYEFDLELEIQCTLITSEKDEIGLVMRASNGFHMSIFCTKRKGELVIVLRKQAADIVSETIYTPNQSLDKEYVLRISGNKSKYQFFCEDMLVGITDQKHLSAECADTPNTGVVGGMYIAGNGKAVVSRFSYRGKSKRER